MALVRRDRVETSSQRRYRKEPAACAKKILFDLANEENKMT